MPSCICNEKKETCTTSNCQTTTTASLIKVGDGAETVGEQKSDVERGSCREDNDAQFRAWEQPRVGERAGCTRHGNSFWRLFYAASASDSCWALRLSWIKALHLPLVSAAIGFGFGFGWLLALSWRNSSCVGS